MVPLAGQLTGGKIRIDALFDRVVPAAHAVVYLTSETGLETVEPVHRVIRIRVG